MNPIVEVNSEQEKGHQPAQKVTAEAKKREKQNVPQNLRQLPTPEGNIQLV